MKKLTILAIAVIAVMGTSCKKPRTCTCTYTSLSGYTGTSSTYTIIDTKKKASASCEALSDSYETCSLD